MIREVKVLSTVRRSDGDFGIDLLIDSVRTEKMRVHLTDGEIRHIVSDDYQRIFGDNFGFTRVVYAGLDNFPDNT